MSKANATKQSILSDLRIKGDSLTFGESAVRFIRFWVIVICCLLDSRDLDCHDFALQNLAMTKWGANRKMRINSRGFLI